MFFLFFLFSLCFMPVIHLYYPGLCVTRRRFVLLLPASGLSLPGNGSRYQPRNRRYRTWIIFGCHTEQASEDTDRTSMRRLKNTALHPPPDDCAYFVHNISTFVWFGAYLHNPDYLHPIFCGFSDAPSSPLPRPAHRSSRNR